MEIVILQVPPIDALHWGPGKSAAGDIRSGTSG